MADIKPKNIHDVIIVGAGPAGLMAARELEKGGIDYLVIDKKAKIGIPLKCAGAISDREFRRFFGDDRFDFIQNKIYKQEVIYGNFRKILYVNGLKLNRPRFEEWLARDLNIELECGLRDLTVNTDSVEIETNKGIFISRLAILSYGCNFSIQKKLGLVKKCPKIMVGFGGTCSNYNLDAGTFYYYLDEDYLQFLWVFPESKETANVGIMEFPGQDASEIKMSTILKERLKNFGLSPNFISYYGGLIPCSGPIQKTYSDRILVCGDAAGHVFAGTGEGIRYALQSGIFAANTAIEGLLRGRFDRLFLRQYEDMWKHNFGKNMNAGVTLFQFLTIAHRLRAKKHLLRYFSESQLTGFFLNGAVPLRAKIISLLPK